MLSPQLYLQGLHCPGGLAFDMDDLLFVAETQQGRIQKIAPAGKPVLFASTGGKPSGIVFDDSNDLFVAERGRRHLLLISPDEAVEVYAHQCKGKRFIGPHDLCFGPAGDLIFTDAGDSTREHPCGSIYSVDLDGEVKQLATGLAGPTGLVISEDSTTLYVAEAAHNRILSMSIGPDGTLADRQVFIQFADGKGPHAILFDAEGRLYITRGGVGLTIADPEGQVIRDIQLPGQEPTGMTFGGPEFDELFVAEARTGAVYCLRTEAPGQRPFAGPRSI